MAAASNQFDKDPQAVLDYLADWSEWLDIDTIATSTWTAPTGITADSSRNTTTTATVWLSGGTLGATYKVVNHIVTTAGRENDQTFIIRMVNK